MKKSLIYDEKWNTKEGWLFVELFNPKPQSQWLAQEAGAVIKLLKTFFVVREGNQWK